MSLINVSLLFSGFKKQKIHDKQIVAIIQAIKLLMPPPEDKSKGPFGFHKKKTRSSKGIY
ncbi:MAG: hypothetical protein ACYS80_09695 [Planctomycetota bacterium]